MHGNLFSILEISYNNHCYYVFERCNDVCMRDINHITKYTIENDCFGLFTIKNLYQTTDFISVW